MAEPAILFETSPPVAPVEPVRTDVACFLGLAAERRDARLPDDLARWLVDRGYAEAAELAVPGGRLFDRPVPVESVEAFEALFDPDARLDRAAEVAGRPLPAPLPPETAIHVVVDGAIREIALGAAPADPAALVAAIRASGAGVEARIDAGGRLVLGRPEGLGRGTFAVLPNAYGFPEALHVRAGTVGSPLAEAVRRFFAMGGRRAYVIRMGDPPPVLADRDRRRRALRRMLVGGVEPAELTSAQLLFDLAGAPPRADIPTRERHGPEHLFGLEDAALLLMPDLPDLVAPPPEPAEPAPPAEAPTEVFAECLPPAEPSPDRLAARLAPPILDAEGAPLWGQALERALRVIRTARRDVILVAALPRASAAVDLVGVAPRSAFLQLAAPWVRTPDSATLPGRLMGADAALAGALAAGALARGPFASVAGRPLGGLLDVEPGPLPALPLTRLARTLRGVRFESDLTTSDDPAWADGPVSRLIGLLFRHALHAGADLPFEPSGPALWRRARGGFERALERVRLAGGFAGTTPAEAYRVRCGRETMTQQDIDAGRLIVEVEAAPARPLQRITVALPLRGASAGAPA